MDVVFSEKDEKEHKWAEKGYYPACEKVNVFSIVIPAYNEEDRIEQTLMNLKREFQGEQVIVIFDGNDHTPDVCRKYGVEVHVYGKKLGKGGALIEGIKKSRGSIIAFIDADMPVSIDDFKKVIKAAVDNDLVISYRIFEDMPAKRLFLHDSFIALTKVLFPELRKFNDLQSGLKVMKADRVKEVLEELVMSDFLIDINLLIAFIKRGFKVKEVPVSWRHTETGSKVSKKIFRIIMLFTLSLIKLRFYYSPLKAVLNTRLYNRAQAFFQKILR